MVKSIIRTPFLAAIPAALAPRPINRHPILQLHYHAPGRAGAAEEYGGQAVPEPLGIPLRLGHPFGQPQRFRPLALDMHTGDAGQIRHFPIALSAASFHRVAVALEDFGKLNFRPAAFCLRTFSAHGYPLIAVIPEPAPAVHLPIPAALTGQIRKGEPGTTPIVYQKYGNKTDFAGFQGHAAKDLL